MQREKIQNEKKNFLNGNLQNKQGSETKMAAFMQNVGVCVHTTTANRCSNERFCLSAEALM